jgi:hypothetical protein
MTAMKRAFLIFLAVNLTWCQSRTLSDASAGPPTNLAATLFPTGTYTNCAQGTHNPSPNLFLNAAGFDLSAVLTLARSGTTLTSRYIDQNGINRSLTFAMTTDTSATLAQKDQTIPGFSSLCVMGPGKQAVHPASMISTGGAVMSNAGAVFLTVTGRLQSDAGACGTRTAPQASFWVICAERQGGAVPSVDAGSAAGAKLPVGGYSCNSQVETYQRSKGVGQFVAGGGSGRLTLTQKGADVITEYSGDSSLSGTLHLFAMTSTTANAKSGQSLLTPCMGATGRSQAAEMLRVSAGSLAIHDSTIFLSFAGTMASTSSCPGAQVAGSVMCSM